MLSLFLLEYILAVIIFPFPDQVLLHSDDEYEYYKVAVANGTRMTEGKVQCEFEYKLY